MSDIPSVPNTPDPGNVLDYSNLMRRSKLAVWSMRLGIIAIPTAFFLVGIPLGIAAVVMGTIALMIMGRNHYVGGKGFAFTGIVTGLVSCVALPMLLDICACGCRPKELANRSACGASLFGIAKALNLYAADCGSDAFPVVMYAPYSPALNNASGNLTSVPSSSATDILASYYHSSQSQAGSPAACLWILVLSGNVSPKQFICKSDPTAPSISDQTDTAGDYYNNFQHGSQMSYSMMYPWDSTGNVSPAWRGTVDSTLPILCDMAPLNGTGTPMRVLNGPKGSAAKMLNSVNHSGGEGQNVCFSDTHVEWVNNPYVGQGGDNIWTIGGGRTTGEAPSGGTPVVPGPINISTISVPFDTVMVPIRNASTGGM